jgi:FAD/FMN-containing dehydrogenase/Fe-S oxidoreductase
MDSNSLRNNLLSLQKEFEGDIYTDDVQRIIYATDASDYREKPAGVVRPKNSGDIKKLVKFANDHKTSLIPRTAGTSLAGQCVGGGIVMDVSKYMTRIIELNPAEHWVRVEPGVNLDELNKFLVPHGLFFGPETSTSSRCMMGGMVGNNSCGAHSILYGSTRDHVISLKTVLSDGSDVEFKEISRAEFDEKRKGDKLENKIYQNIFEILSKPENQAEIRKEYPEPRLRRRNTGYAIDLLLETEPFTQNKEKFNFCKLLAGSEGTLAMTYEIKLNLVPVPPKEVAIVAVHFAELRDAFHANLIALQHNPGAVELLDGIVIACTKDNIEQKKNRFFIDGDPAAILLIEFARETREEIAEAAKKMESDMRTAGYGYHFPVIYGDEVNKIWSLRKAGEGLLSNVKGDRKPVTVIEDTAIYVDWLAEYAIEFQGILKKYDMSCVFYAHIGSGELHLRPMLNLRDPKDVELFHTIGFEIAKLVKKHKGSLSGEHGDGRLRGEFIPLMIGNHNYALLKELKKAWDPNCIFNPGKITDTPPMNSSLRYEVGAPLPEIKTYFDFSKSRGILRAAEKCNGAGDCRKSEIIGGTMCPSYMATRDENKTTRSRANVLREFLTRSGKANRFDHKEIYEVMDLCLSCKGCKSECPSNVDMAKLKAEFLQHYYDANGVPFRSWMIANISKFSALGAVMPAVANFFFTNKFLSSFLKKSLGFAPLRNIPLISKTSLRRWFKANKQLPPKQSKGKVYLFSDEFTNFNDTEIGIKAILLLTRLGYEVTIPKHVESGRAYISKGMLKKAKQIAESNILLLKDVISAQMPLIGIEPSAILSFRDEYPELVTGQYRADAEKLAEDTKLIDEFLADEVKKGNITADMFTTEAKSIKLHGHCQQKSIASTSPTKILLTLPKNYTIEEIKSGCCGMAGSFGYEKEHYELSMKVGELVLFPEIRKTANEVIIAAAGTSCRHQIKDGTGRQAKHPVEILYEALK